MALNSLLCADVPLSNYSLTHEPTLARSGIPVERIGKFRINFGRE